MRFAFYGDDFTGSVDALLQFRLAGLAGVLVTDADAVPGIDTGEVDVVGIAGVARSLPVSSMAAEVAPALRALLARNPEIVQYKACSTADSSATVGSLGRVLEIAGELAPHGPIPICFAQPDFGRYTFFGQHFARDGDLVHRLDRQPTMRSHPVTPATEADLRLMLAAQTALPLGALPWTSYGHAPAPDRSPLPDRAGDAPGQTCGQLPGEASGQVSGKALGQVPSVAAGLAPGSGAVAGQAEVAPELMAALARTDVAALVCDAFTDGQLDQLAGAILADRRRPRFVLGAGGLSAAIGRAAGGDRRRAPLPREITAAAGPVLVLSGSTSGRTAVQIESAAALGWVVLDLFDPGIADEAVARQARGEHVVVTSALGTAPGAAPHAVPDVAPAVSDVASGAVPNAPGREASAVSDAALGGIPDAGLGGVPGVAPAAMADRIDVALAAVGLRCLAAGGTDRVVLCGGDTSGRVLRRLGVRALTVRAAPWDNVALCRAQRAGGPDFDVVLKGGQMGHPSLFDDVRTGRSIPGSPGGTEETSP